MSLTARDAVPFLHVSGLSKSYGGVQALRDIDLDIYPGEVHGLVGANGAGKSTLIRLLAGAGRPDAGVVQVAGVTVEITSPQEATRLGLAFIHQELNLVPKFSALQNMTLGLPKAARAGLIDWRSVRARVSEVAVRLGMDFPLNTAVERLTVVEKWLVSIARALVRNARLIAMDEPTASLSAGESERLFTIVRELSAAGIAVLYVSHRLDEILELCSHITVFKDGQRSLDTPRAALDKPGLVRAIVGAEVTAAEDAGESVATGPVVLEAQELWRLPAVRGVSLTLRAGEVVGLSGLVGAGRTELARLLFGADRLSSGQMTLAGRPYQPRGPYDAVRSGIALVPEERRSEGLLLDKSVDFNLNLAHLAPLRLGGWFPFLGRRRSVQRAAQMATQLQVKATDMSVPARQLSGGNQQKVVIGKWLMRSPRLLILDEPSRGVDVGARAEIHRLIRALAHQGTAVLVISSDTEELPGLCDRALVMVEGRVHGELVGQAVTREALLELSFSRPPARGA